MGRRSIWSDPKIIELAKQFVPAADEVWRLQRDDDPECRFFRRMVRGTEAASRGTMQGTYVFAPDGKLLGRINSSSADATRAVLERALREFSERPTLKLADTSVIDAGFRWEDSYPDGGLVLMRTARDLPAPPRQGPKATKSMRYNRDPVWFSKSEAGQWLPAKLERGESRLVSRTVAHRLAQFVFVDNVRGQSLPFHDSEVRSARIESEITAVDGHLVHIRIVGETRAIAKGPWLFGDNDWKPSRTYPHSMATRLLGTASFDAKKQAFETFEVVALGRRTGHTQLNGRGSKNKSNPVGFVLRLAPTTWRVAPTFINVYNADWVKHPD